MNQFLDAAARGYAVVPFHPVQRKPIVGPMRFGNDADTRRTFDSWLRSYPWATPEMELGESGVIAFCGDPDALAMFAKTHGIAAAVTATRSIRSNRGMVVRNEHFAIVRRPDGSQLVPFEVDGIAVLVAGSSPIPSVSFAELPTLSKKTVAFLVEAPAKIAAAKLAETLATRELQSGRVPMPPPAPGAMQVVRAWSGVLGAVSFNFRPGQCVEDPRVQEMVADLHILGPIGSPLQQSAPLKPGQIRLLADVNGNLAGHFLNAVAGKVYDDADGALARIFEANRVPIERAASAAA
ncbi:MAG: hypothetical protein NVSMB64_15470 [Candidatus Velthaea sp.]